MTAQVLIIKNSSPEGPGLIAGVLAQNNLVFDTVDLDAGQAFPDPARYRAVVVLGGPDSANDRTAKMQAELTRVQACLERGIPYLGICLGLQVLVKAAGGEVVKSPVREIGFLGPDREIFSVELTADGVADPLLAGLASRLEVFHLHGETVALTPKMTLLAAGKFCQNQIVRVAPRAYGLQCHFELTSAMMNDWLATDPDLKQQNPNEQRAIYQKIQSRYEQTARVLITNFFKLAGLVA